MLLKMI